MATTSVSNFTISAADVSWGRRERTCVTSIVGTSLDAKSFNLDAPASNGGASAAFYVWFDTGASIDPATAGRTGIQVIVDTGDTAAEVATLAVAAIDGNANFRAIDNADGTFIIENTFFGDVTAATVDVDSSMTFDQQRSGVGGDLGTTSGGVSAAFEITTIEVKADQTGEALRDKFITGTKATVTMSLLEMTAARWSDVVGSVSGDNFTPSGGTKLTGFGESRAYASMFDLSGELILHPTKNAASNKAEDLTFWLTAPIPSSYNFSGTDVSVMEVTFEALIDQEKETAINLFAYGDGSQDVQV